MVLNEGIMKKLLLIFCIIGASILSAQTSETWSREIITPLGKIKVYQPEIETLSDNLMESRSTVLIEKEGQKSIFGAVWFENTISTDLETRKITLIDAEITASQFPEMNEGDVDQINQFIENDISKWDLEYSLDELLSTVEYDQSKTEPGINNTPPTILFTTVPTALILINGDPIFQDIENTNLKYVVNTPFLIVQDKKSNKLYLKGGKYWYTSENLFNGWQFAKEIPASLVDLQNKNPSAVEDSSSQLITNFIVRTDPSELLSSNGNPEFAPIKNTGLLYMVNTDNDILLNIASQEYFVLLAGRWYKSADLQSNQWTFVSPDSLPVDFYNIGDDTPVSNILAHIPGTKEAKMAVLETQIPQTAEIDRHSTNYQVTYDGKPTFKKIQDTEMLYAINTEKDVLLINGTFYSCDNGIWYESKDANGPWIVSIRRPSEVDDIPLEYPIHRVKYVYVFDYTPDIVIVGYYSGYLHSYVYRGTVFYGSGYYYRPWYRTYYYPYPVTFGYGAFYNTRTGWSFSYGLSYGGYYWLHDDYFYRSYYRGLWGHRGYRYYYTRPSHIDHRRGYYNKTRRKMRVDYREVAQSPRYKMAGKSNNLYLRSEKGVKRTGNTVFDSRSGKPIRNNHKNLQPRIEKQHIRNTSRPSRVELKNTIQRQDQWKNVTPRRKRTDRQRDVQPRNIQPRKERPQNNNKINLFETNKAKEENQVERDNQYRSENRSNERRSERQNNLNSNSREDRRIDRRIDRRGR